VQRVRVCAKKHTHIRKRVSACAQRSARLKFALHTRRPFKRPAKRVKNGRAVEPIFYFLYAIAKISGACACKSQTKIK